MSATRKCGELMVGCPNSNGRCKPKQVVPPPFFPNLFPFQDGVAIGRGSRGQPKIRLVSLCFGGWANWLANWRACRVDVAHRGRPPGGGVGWVGGWGRELGGQGKACPAQGRAAVLLLSSSKCTLWLLSRAALRGQGVAAEGSPALSQSLLTGGRGGIHLAAVRVGWRVCVCVWGGHRVWRRSADGPESCSAEHSDLLVSYPSFQMTE
jgi:hypothetical protein